jgi:hypothetical protein
MMCSAERFAAAVLKPLAVMGHCVCPHTYFIPKIIERGSVLIIHIGRCIEIRWENSISVCGLLLDMTHAFDEAKQIL